MKKLLREQMKKVTGGLLAPCKSGLGTAAAGDSCYFSQGNCAHTCKSGLTCHDNGNETGSTCKTTVVVVAN